MTDAFKKSAETETTLEDSGITLKDDRITSGDGGVTDCQHSPQTPKTCSRLEAKMLEMYGPREKWNSKMRFCEKSLKAMAEHQLMVEHVRARIESGEFKKKNE